MRKRLFTYDCWDNYEGKPRTNEADIALDIWAKLDGRREDTNFSMSTEPLVQVREVDE